MILSFHGRGILWFVLLLFIPFLITVRILPNDLFIQIARTFHASVCTAVIVSYGTAAWRSFRKPAFNSNDILAMAIFSSFVGNLGLSTNMLLWRVSGKPEWLVDSWTLAFWVAMQTVSGVLYLAAPGAIDGHVPPRRRIIIGASLGMGLLVVIAFALAHIDVYPFLEIIRPWVDEEMLASI